MHGTRRHSGQRATKGIRNDTLRAVLRSVTMLTSAALARCRHGPERGRRPAGPAAPPLPHRPYRQIIGGLDQFT